jgi:hypothetical protein
VTIAKYDRPVYKLTCDTCGTDATHDDGMPWYFESRDVAAIWARDFEWDGPWCLNDGVPTHCPDCAAKAAEEKARAESDQEHHQQEINAAISYALNDHA